MISYLNIICADYSLKFRNFYAFYIIPESLNLLIIFYSGLKLNIGTTSCHR